ncbi:MAG: hypothetical protein ACYDAD_11170 [Acidimicrobiales bacterium]
MATAVASYRTRYTTQPYLSISEWKNTPTAMDVSSLIPQGSAAQENQALADVIRRASGWVDELCGQILTATIDIENGRPKPNRHGEITVITRNWPILEVQDFQYGTQPNQLQAVADLTGLFIELNMFTVTPGPGVFTSQAGPFAIGPAYRYGGPVFCRWTYVNGYPHTQLTADAAAGAMVIQVRNPVGIYGGPTTPLANVAAPPASLLTIVDGAATEDVSVASVAGNMLTLNAPLLYSHTQSVLTAPDFIPVTAIPPPVKEAAILVTAAIIKTRGSDAVVMDSMDGLGHIQAMSGMAIEDLAIAVELLEAYRRVV